MKKILKIDDWIKYKPLFIPIVNSIKENAVVVERLADKARFALGTTVISQLKGAAKINQFLTDRIHVAIIFSGKYNGQKTKTQYVSIVPISDLEHVEFDDAEFENRNKVGI
jgi:hypothetical protein